MQTLRVRFACLLLLACVLGAPARAQDKSLFFRDGDRVAWVGSSSTKIGVWPATVEFLVRTRHPKLDVTFQRFTTGGGTFATGLENMDKWLADYKPTLVLFNYGGNDAGAGEKGLAQFKTNMEAAVEKAKKTGARVIVMTHQSADVRHPKVGPEVLGKRKLYAETMIAHGREKGWDVIDTHHPLEQLQLRAEREDPAFTILKDSIHLTDAAYVAWGYYLYDRLSPPPAESAAKLTADGKVEASTHCRISDVAVKNGTISFTRADEILPILPPIHLPPAKHVPLIERSKYVLTIRGLDEGRYAVVCDGKAVGVTDAAALAKGVNLNTLLIEQGNEAPWAGLATELWNGKSLDRIGKTSMRFEVRPQ